MNFYSMSETGSCPRVLSAQKLGNEPKSRSELDLDRLSYYSSLEAVAADRLGAEGFTVIDAGECPICHNGRCGHHIEMEEGLFKLVGHLDRRIILPDGRQLPVEIKSLGDVSWKEMEKTQFKDHMSYAFQEACYLKHENSPGIYWVMHRDNGRILKYIVNDTNNEYNLSGFTKITLPITYDQIIDKLNLVEIDVADNKLCDPDPNNDCFWCGYKYLCTGTNTKLTIFADDPKIKQAAEDYKKAQEQYKLCEKEKQDACNTLVEYAKVAGNEKFKTGNISFSYHGLKYKVTTDEDKLGRLLQSYNMTDSAGIKVTYDDIMKQVEKRSKMFDSYTIRIIETPEK